ncbi:hypothetical protein ATY81_07745 [Rhizobium sp. R72]|uniref:hypothetical protein n=1 Tax=unclassified Rhizobium TaxID=2613769 RepID=UPI000B52F1E2|nr:MULTISPECIES: hypothetical protein [unclassified Rhizobium]OWV97327.1 hypothetical protein ATY81_07745 [Rhizobium sp. R72]OWV97666.1 hypothetical protein ATY80_07745 [Rhizobium sp. R711]
MRTGSVGRKTFWSIAAVIALTLVGVTAGKFMLEKAVDSFLVARGGKASSVEADLLGRIHMRDVTLPTASGGNVRVAAIDGRPTLLFLKGKLEVKGLELDMAMGKLSVPQASVEEPDFIAAALIESGGQTNLTLLKRIERFAAKRVMAPEVAVSQLAAGSEQKTVYKDVALEDIAGGRVARYSASGASFKFALDLPDGEGATKREEMNGSMGAVTGKDFDAAYLVRMYVEKAGPDNREPQPLYGPMSVRNISFSDNKSRFSYDEVRSNGLSVRMPNEPLLETLQKLQSANPEALPPGERQAFFKRVLSLADIIGKADIEMLGLKMEVPEKINGGDGKAVKLTVDKMAFQLDGRTFDGALHGVFMGEGADYARFSEASIKGFSWDPTMEALTKMAGLDEDQIENFPFATLMPSFGTIRVAGLDVDMPGSEAASALNSEIGEDEQSANGSETDPSLSTGPSPDAGLTNEADNQDAPLSEAQVDQATLPAVPERIRFTLDNYELALGKPYNGIPTDIRISYRDLSVPIPSDTKDEGSEALRKLGFDKLVLSSNVELAWDEPNENLLVKEISLSGKDLGGFSFSGRMGGATKDFFSGDMTAVQMALFGLTAREAKLKIEDKGIVAKGIKLYADENSMTEDSVRGILVLMVTAGLQQFASTEPKLQEAATALSQFITKPGTFTLTVRAKDAAGIGALELAGATENPALLLDKVDLEATAQ